MPSSARTEGRLKLIKSQEQKATTAVCVACIRINMMAAVQGWMCGWSYTNSVVYVWIMKTSWAESVKCNGKWGVYILWSIFVLHDKLHPTSVKSWWRCSCKQCLHNRETSGSNKPFPGSERKTRVLSRLSAFNTTFHARVRKSVVLLWKLLCEHQARLGFALISFVLPDSPQAWRTAAPYSSVSGSHGWPGTRLNF